MFHVDNLRPKKDGVCDQCGSPLIQRDDDKPEVIQKRLQVYHQQTAPVADHYRRQNKLKTLDATASPDAVYGALTQALAGQ
jgi:adenylate kinase